MESKEQDISPEEGLVTVEESADEERVESVTEVAQNLPESINDGAQNQSESAEKAAKRKKIKQFFSPRKIATLGVFTALAFVVSLLDFPIFPQAAFLKLDFSNVFIMLMGFAFGPVEAAIVCVVKELIHIPIGTTGGVGELANIVMGCAFLIIPSTVYYFKKRFWVVIPSLAAGIVLQTAAALVCNRYITFPLYMGEGAVQAFGSLYYFIIFFNLIKGAVISVICVLLYKYLSKALKKLKVK